MTDETLDTVTHTHTHTHGYSLNGITLYNEDCLNILDTMQEKSVDLIVTDCPYHIVGRWL